MRELRDFTIPNFVLFRDYRGESVVAGSSVPIGSLDEMQLSDLCNNFRANVFEAAGKVDPLVELTSEDFAKLMDEDAYIAAVVKANSHLYEENQRPFSYEDE